LLDAGPLVALFDASDRHHRWAVEALRVEPYPLATTWPVLAETAAMLGTECWIDCLEFANAGGMQVHELPRSAIPELIRWARKYRDLPMDLGDASLVVLAGLLGTRRIITIDSDFAVYRLAGNKTFELIHA
jgi:hypothetical protein